MSRDLNHLCYLIVKKKIKIEIYFMFPKLIPLVENISEDNVGPEFAASKYFSVPSALGA